MKEKRSQNIEKKGHRQQYSLVIFFVFLVLFLLPFYKNYALAAGLMYTEWENNLHAGIGHAGVASPDDVESIFTNPALMARFFHVRSKRFLQSAQPPLPNTMAINGHSLPQFPFPTSLSQTAKPFIESADGTSNDTQAYGSLQMFPYALLSYKLNPAFLVGFPIRTEQKLSYIDGDDSGNLNYHSVTTYTTLLGTAISNRTNGFKAGFTLRLNYREEYYSDNLDKDKTSLKDFYGYNHDNSATTFGINMDAGVALTLYDYWFPTIAASISNIPTGCVSNYYNPIKEKVEKVCGTTRSKVSIVQGRDEAEGSSGLASKIDPTVMRAGASITPRLFKIYRYNVRLRLAAELSPVPVTIGSDNFGVFGSNLMENLHLGSRIYLGHALDQYGPYGSVGYEHQALTWGGGVILGFLRLEYSSYLAKDFMTSATTEGEFVPVSERRHLFSLKVIL